MNRTIEAMNDSFRTEIDKSMMNLRSVCAGKESDVADFCLVNYENAKQIATGEYHVCIITNGNFDLK